MFESILEETTASTTISTSDAVICILIALGLGVVISLSYMFTQRKRGFSQGFAFSLIIIPAVVTVIIMLVGSNVARAFSLAGAFSLVRFRSAPGEAKDITYIFLSMTLGLATGMGYIQMALFFVVIICLAMIALSFIKLGGGNEKMRELKIIIPEDLNYDVAFNDILEKYTNHYELIRVKTINMGTLFEITYKINIKNEIQSKEFIDELRTRNGNLGISILRCNTEIPAVL